MGPYYAYSGTVERPSSVQPLSNRFTAASIRLSNKNLSIEPVSILGYGVSNLQPAWRPGQIRIDVLTATLFENYRVLSYGQWSSSDRLNQ